MGFWTPFFEGAILLFDVFCFGTSYMIYDEQKKVLRNLEQAVQLDVNQNLGKFLDLHPDKKIGYAGIRGKVFSLVSETEGPIQDLQDIFRSVKKYGRYILRNPYNAAPEFQHSNVKYPLTLYSAVDNDSKKLPFTVLVDSISWADQFRLRSNAFDGSAGPVFYSIKDKIAFPEEGALITVYGTVSRVSQGEIRIQYTGDDGAPFIFTKFSPEELISTQRYYVNFSRVMLLCFAAFGMVALGKFVYAEWRKYCRHHKKLEIFEELLPAITNERIQLDDENMNPDSVNEDAHTLCVICKAAPRNTLFIECNHLCACQQCAKETNGTCPICSRVSEPIIPAYIS